MATSGTAVWNPNILEIVEEAYERNGIEMRTGYEMVTARRSLNYLFSEWANRGINMWTLEPDTLTLVANQTTPYDLPADTVDIMDASIRTNSGNSTSQNDLTITRISFDTYQTLPNKLSTGRPTQYMIQRTATPKLYLWLWADGTQDYTLYYWRMRRIQDAGSSAALTADVPFRFLAALTSGLAYHIGAKRRRDPQLLAELKARYDEDWERATSEDFERASWMIVPYQGFSR